MLDLVGHAQLPEVVGQGGVANGPLLHRRQPELRPDLHRQLGDRLLVQRGIGVTSLHRGAEDR